MTSQPISVQDISVISVYQLKPAFQALLRPLVRSFAQAGITANAVTLVALLISLVVGAVLAIWGPEQRSLFLLLPLWMFARMAFNAVDGMLAREFNQRSALGAYFNELSDVVADAALYLPLVFISPFDGWTVGLVIWLAALSEMAGAIGPMVGAPRRYDGPMGKSDRALIFGALGLWIGLSANLPGWVYWLMPLVAGAMLINIGKRIRHGVAQASRV